jgi:Flp pilus assembly pilin Flp
MLLPQGSIRRFLEAEDGPAAVEYAVMLALIIVVCIGTIGALGIRTRDICDIVCMALERRSPTPPTP